MSVGLAILIGLVIGLAIVIIMYDAFAEVPIYFRSFRLRNKNLTITYKELLRVVELVGLANIQLYSDFVTVRFPIKNSWRSKTYYLYLRSFVDLFRYWSFKRNIEKKKATKELLEISEELGKDLTDALKEVEDERNEH